MPGILVMILLLAVMLSAQALVEERRNGILERLLTTQLTSNQLFLGKFFAGITRTMFQAVVLLALAFVVLRPGGLDAFFLTLAVALLLAAAVSAIGLVISAVARTPDQASWAAVSITMFMTVFGGTFFELVPGSALEMLSRFTLNRYAIDAIGGIVDGSETLAAQGTELAVMGGVAVVGLLRHGCCSGRQEVDARVMTFVRQSLLLAGKDTRIFFKDRFAVVFAFAFPLLFTLGFTLALGGILSDDEPLKITLVTREEGEGSLSRQIIDGLAAGEHSR